MILMVSVQDAAEAIQALRGGADIVDVKDLQEALVGSAQPGVVKEVRETVPPDLEVAKHYIDLLDLLKNKTSGNTTNEETRLLDGIAHEMRLTYVQAASGGPSAAPDVKP